MARGSTPKPDSPGYGIAAVDRTFDVVAAVMHAGPAPLAAIADQAGCNRATAFRILHTLRDRGLVVQDGPRGHWRLGTAWLAVARAAQKQGALELAAAPAMATLASMCHEGVYLLVRDGQEAETLAVHARNSRLRLYAKPGDRMPLHAGPGRLLLAYAPPAIQRAVLAGRLASSGRTDAEGLSADLKRISARGWLVTQDEVEEGAVTVSMAVRDSAGSVLAALSIISPALRLRRPQALLDMLMDAAGSMGAAAGVVL